MQAAAERLDGLAPGPEVEGLRARVWLASGRREEAVALARTVVAAHPTAWSALLTLATSAVREGRATEADALIHRLERIHGGGAGPFVDVVLLRNEWLGQMGRLAEVVPRTEHALRQVDGHEPEATVARLALATEYRRHGRGPPAPPPPAPRPPPRRRAAAQAGHRPQQPGLAAHRPWEARGGRARVPRGRGASGAAACALPALRSLRGLVPAGALRRGGPARRGLPGAPARAGPGAAPRPHRQPLAQCPTARLGCLRGGPGRDAALPAQPAGPAAPPPRRRGGRGGSWRGPPRGGCSAGRARLGGSGRS